mmetsp:Transcript_1761/g.3924  ORF Transcript_1761/g.3924 Transcript_1761/m.3924 type:complete len:211 (-) Transcript_1761:324-956(-)
MGHQRTEGRRCQLLGRRARRRLPGSGCLVPGRQEESHIRAPHRRTPRCRSLPKPHRHRQRRGLRGGQDDPATEKGRRAASTGGFELSPKPAAIDCCLGHTLQHPSRHCDMPGRTALLEILPRHVGRGANEAAEDHPQNLAGPLACKEARWSELPSNLGKRHPHLLLLRRQRARNLCEHRCVECRPAHQQDHDESRIRPRSRAGFAAGGLG